jgi:topoisomerase-4 subunit A
MSVTPKDVQIFLSARARKGEAFIGRTQPVGFVRETPLK